MAITMEKEHSITCTLSTALSIFKDQLPEIRDVLKKELSSDLATIPAIKFTTDDSLLWVRTELREARIRKISEKRLRVIKRINGTLEHHTDNKNRITDEHIARAKEVLIADLFDTRLFKGGKGRMVGRCPFHGSGNERTPSFYIMTNNKGHCFGCSWHGDSIDFVMQRDGVKFIQAVKKLNNI